MIYLIAGLVATSVTLVIVLVAQTIPTRTPGLGRRLAEIGDINAGALETLQRRRRQERRQRWEGVVQALGERITNPAKDDGPTRKLLLQAGLRGSRALSLYRGTRVVLPIASAGAAIFVAPVVGISLGSAFFGAFWLAAVGWIAPAFYVGRRAKARKKELQLALPDTLDLMVVCVEAGLGLNQAIVRVSEEIRHVSMVTSQEFALVNLEIRAGTSREDALRNLGERTGQEDLRSLVAMLIQTDRFGTSIAQALRVHSDTLRAKRKQRAEEAAAKTTIKMLFPLVMFIFPAMFVVILGPAIIQIIQTLSGVQ
jgi:tight adherence protein C